MDNKKTSEWTTLILAPTDELGSSLSAPLLGKLIDEGLVSKAELLEYSPIPLDLDRTYKNWASPYRGKISAPTWIHWMLKQRDIDPAALAMLEYIPVNEWIRPFWGNNRAVDILAKQMADKTLAKIFKKLDASTMEQVRDYFDENGSRKIHLCEYYMTSEMIHLLARFGWDVNEPSVGKHPKAPIEAIGSKEAFIALVENGVDLFKARENVNRITSVAKERQELLQLISSTAASKTSSLAPWQQEHDAVVGIIETGVSGGFARKLANFIANYPQAPEQGLTVNRGSIGWGMLDFARHNLRFGRGATKAKSYYTLADILLEHQDNPWVNLNSSVRGPGMEGLGLTNYDCLMAGTLMNLLMEHRGRGENGSPWRPKAKLPTSVETHLIKWLEERMDEVVLTLAGQAELSLSNLPKKTFRALRSWAVYVSQHLSNGKLDTFIKRYMDNLEQDNALLVALRDNYNELNDEENEDPDERDIVEFVEAREVKTYWDPCFVDYVNDFQFHNTAWVQAAGNQFRAMATNLLFKKRDYAVVKQFEALSWVLEPENMERDQESWERWADDMATVGVPLYKVEWQNLSGKDQKRYNQLNADIFELEGIENIKDMPTIRGIDLINVVPDQDNHPQVRTLVKNALLKCQSIQAWRPRAEPSRVPKM